MSTSLSKLVDNSSEGHHNNKCADCKSCKSIYTVGRCLKNYL